jgi:hypothetical protein
MKKLTWILILFLIPGIGLGADDVCVHLNGGDDVAYIGELNTLEIWISNDITVRTMQFPFEVCWTSDVMFWNWNMDYGDNPPFNRHGDALTYLMLFGHQETFDEFSCETFAAGATSIVGDDLPPGTSRLMYSLQFAIIAESEAADAISVAPYAYFGGNNWFFQDPSAVFYKPDFCGQTVASIVNPDAPPVTFDIVYRTQSTCGDSDCSGAVDIDDVVWLINYIFTGGNAPCDTDGDGVPDC